MNNENNTGIIEVPRYISEIFGRKLSKENQSIERTKKAKERIYKLIANALDDLPDTDWEIWGTNCKSNCIVEPIGMESDGALSYIYGEERGRKTPFAIFKDSHLAADYFVWLVSKGQRKINWELFLEMVL